MEYVLSLDPYTFDQTDDGWRGLDKKGKYLEAAKLIESYMVQNEPSIEAQGRVSLQTIHFHAGQEYAMSGEANYSRAVEHFRQSFKESTSWNIYVNGSIAFLERNIESLILSSQELDTFSAQDSRLDQNAALLRRFLDALKADEYLYAAVYG